MSKMSELHAAVAQAEALEQSRCVQSQETAAELRAAMESEPIITNAMLRAQDQARIAELEAENKTFRAAQKACETCDAPTMARIAELEGLLLRVQSHGLDEGTPMSKRERVAGVLHTDIAKYFIDRAQAEKAADPRIAELEFALTIARQALLYHTAQTRPIDDTSVALATINAALKGGE